MQLSRTRLPLVVLVVVAGAAICVAAIELVRRASLQELQANAVEQLDRFSGYLNGSLSRFEFIPELVASDERFVQVLRDSGNPARVELVNRHLEEINAVTGASDTYLMNAEGVTVAASNWQRPQSFVGKNFSFRPYFQQAMRGQLGRYFALGTTSRQRGYYFAYPIVHAAETVGVIVLKMDLTRIESHWSGREGHFLVTDPDGVVFITTWEDWLFHTLGTLPAEVRQRIALTRRYPGMALDPLPMALQETGSTGARMVRVNGASPVAGRYLMLSRAMPEAGWTARIFLSTGQVTRDMVTAGVLGALSILLMLASATLVWQRARRRKERERMQAEVQRLLEKRVEERTADLTREIDERRRAESALRETQGELIQAAKLALLGQLSASISHELNNPLAAIRSYADNARAFLARDDAQEADGNLRRIVGLTERMAQISSQLKVFARKSSGKLQRMSTQGPIQAAVEIIRPQARRLGVQIHVEQPLVEGVVRAEAIQLEQVLVNLLSNAVQAVQAAERRDVSVRTRVEAGRLIIDVEVSGAGISAENLDRIFDPFFTTRESGLGLGLSISYRIIDSMGGALSAENIDGAGARFTVSLPIAEPSP